MSVLTAPNATLPEPSRPPLGRLALVELRKFCDTRSGLSLLAIIVLLTLGAVLLAGFTFDASDQDLQTLFEIALVPAGILLPIVGILGFTAEFSQRTALQTFVWIPQRARVVAAKAAALLLLGLIGFVLSAVFTVVTAAAFGFEMNLTGGVLGQGLLFAELNVLFGLGFGMLFGSPALAIVVYFAAPAVVGILSSLVGFIEDAADWLDPTRAFSPLSDFSVSSGDWGNIALGIAVWIVLPTAIGWVLLRRREVS